ncbi:MAG: glycosyltransferase family 4 protein [Lysobacterales bacterium]
MAVVFINRFAWPDHSATSQLLSDLAAGLVARGMRVTVVASRLQYDDAQVRLPLHEVWKGVAFHRVQSSALGRARLWRRAIDYLTFYLMLPAALCKVLGRGDVVVVKTDPPLLSLLVGAFARWRGALLVNWLQDVFPEVAMRLRQPPVPVWLGFALQKLRNRSLRRAAMNVAIGQRMAETLRELGVADRRLQVVCNWAHEDAIRPLPAARSALRHRLRLDGQFVVGYSGNLGRAHDIDTLFDAAERLRDQEAIAFLVIGGGHGYQLLQERCRAASLGQVHFLPYQPIEALADAMAAADLHLVSLLPSLEGLIVPSKFYGIAAAERPIGFVGDPDGELARLIAGNDCGFSVAWGDGAALARQILASAADPARGRAQGQHARELLERDFSRAAAHARWHDLLNALTTAGPADKPHPSAVSHSAPPRIDS